MVSKRTSSIAFPQAEPTKRRITATPASVSALKVTNLENDEVVHQACLLLTGECPSYENAAEDHITIHCSDTFNTVSTHNWPVVGGRWKALVLVECGQNNLNVEFHHAAGISARTSLGVVYEPLLQTPPLYLAIMVAKDSPLLIDCPPAKFGAFSTAHSNLDAAIAKFRTTALMWQAQTAEDMRMKSLGRRSFRLEEEWSTDTLSMQGSRGTAGEQSIPMKSVPKVHIIRTEHTVAEIRDSRYAQQNPQATRDQWLHEIFTRALKKHGPPFDSSCRPVVAGLILDSHYSVEQNLILGHAALGCHNANGLSLGIFGSHLTYSWPRFFDEIASCLSDSTHPGDSVGNDNNECTSMARACYIGQGAFLHEVGHAFGADHTTGIMARGYSQHWGHNFLAQESEKDHGAKWDLQDALRFQSMPHFRIPGDEPVTSAFTDAELRIEIVPYDEASTSMLQITSAAGLAKASIGNKSYDLMESKDCTEFRFAEFDKLDRSKPLEVSALAMNGKTKIVKDAWKLLASKPYVDVPGTSTKLRKRSIKASNMDRDSHGEEYCQWSVLLRKYGTSGSLSRVSAIDLRVGATFDGVYVYYADGSRQNCGPALDTNGSPFTFGGGSAEKAKIPKKARITKIEICERGGWDGLDGIRMTLSTGHVWGCLNAYGNGHRIHTLEPAADEKIVGFFGASGNPADFGFIKEFGIITAPKDFKVPDEVYDMDCLQNTGDPETGDESMSDAESDSQSTVS